MTGIGRAALSLLALLAFTASACEISLAAEKPAKLARVRIGYVSRSILDMPYIIARDRGLFREEGLEPELIFMKAAQTVPAMLAGGVDFGTATGTAVAAAVSGVDVRIVFALTDRPSFDLIVAPSITSVQQLRGKKLGITAYGALAEILARQILIAQKVPADQVTFLPMGTSDVTYLALKAGTIDGTMLQIPQTFLAQEDGFRKLASGAEVYRAVQGGLTTTRTIITERPELVTRMIRATQRSLRLIRSDKKFALEFIRGPYLDLGKERERFAEQIYDAALQYYLQSGAVDEKLQREMITVAAQRVKGAQPAPPERVFDFSFARKVSETLR
ncbi:MAG TPA: ABC transporter substrate-binding protein [Candidatus Binatia bacterium]|nr:ABC transporter substrate-binding protein [Candidatus Binatia bacterium]